MTRILTYKQIDRQQWSELVRTSETGTWFQSPGAYDFFASMPELMEPFVYGLEHVRELGNERISELAGICVGYVTKERSAIRQFFTRRAIIIGGPAIAKDATSEEVDTLMKAVRKQFKIYDLRFKILNSPIYIETRNFNDYTHWKEAFETARFAYQPHLNFHVDPSVNNLSDNRCRQVRKAQATVECLTSERVKEEDIREWYKVLAELYRTKVKTPLWPIEFFLEAYRQGIAKFLLVKHEGRIIGGSMVVMWKPNPGPSLKGRENAVQESFAKVWGAHTADSTQYELLEANAREHRKNPTEAESVLWDILKGNGIGLHFRRQHVILDYIVDFICLEKGLVIELDGDYHNNPEQKEYDERRTAHLQRLGYTELRFTNEELLCSPDAVIERIKAVASKLPSLQGGAGDRLGTVYEWFECGLNAEYKDQYPSVMATYAGIQLAHQSGCSRYDMMGAGEPGVPYGVRDFKAEFGGTLVEHGRFLCVCKPMLYKIGTIGIKILKRK